jgi:hypothetical protein
MPPFFPTAARNHVPVVISDTTTLPVFSALHVGGAGDVVVTSPLGVDATFKGLAAGSLLEVAGVKVKATGTTATFLVAIYA